MALQIGTRLGAYEILGQLGQGGMGEVYRATDTKLARTVALKVLSPALTGDADYMARFTREAHILASFNHPNIALIYGLEDSGSVRALVMELVEGRNLAECIAAGSLGMEETLLIAKQVAEALEAAHDKGIVHRDLKPANIMLTPEGVVKVLDFGLAKQSETRASSGDPALSLTVRATQAGVVMGTAGYMAPEQAAARPADRRADIWAFGVVLWEMLCRKPLFSGETIAHTLADVLRAEIDLSKLPAETPPPIRDLLSRCLERDVKKRLQAIGEARIAIEKHLADPAPVKSAVPAPSQSSRLPWAIAAVVTLVALGLGVTHWRESPPPKQVLRFTIPEPSKSPIHTFAISPDGRYLAVAASNEGKRKLFLRPMDSYSYQELANTEGAMYPFWSPDSRMIGFFADGKLKKASLDGVPVMNLCDAPEGRGGTWSSKGDIVFAPKNNSALARVAASGGASTPVTRTEGQVTHRFPYFLPDGRRFLYLQTLGEASKEGIYVASLDGGEPSRVLTDQSSVAYVPPQDRASHGHLLFHRQGTLMAQPVDEASLATAGELFPIAEEVGIANRNYSQMSVSRNGTLLYREAGLSNSQLNWMDRSGKVVGKLGEPGRNGGYSLSLDGKFVVSARGAASVGSLDIWMHEVERGVDTRLTFDSGLSPVWTPDRGSVAYYNTSELRLIRTDGQGSGKVLVSGVGVFAAPLDFSRDGKYLLYLDGSGTNIKLMVKPMEGDGKPFPFAPSRFSEGDARFSPDGKWVAYTSLETGASEVYVRPFPPGAGKWKVSERGGFSPRWSPDGKELYFLAPDMTMMAASVETRGAAFAVSGTQALFASGISNALGVNPFFRGFQISPDGKRFLVLHRLGDNTGTPIRAVVNWLEAVKR